MPSQSLRARATSSRLIVVFLLDLLVNSKTEITTTMTEIINAFHPSYVKTYMPEFMGKLRKESKQVEDGKKHGHKSRASRESVHEKSFSEITHFPKTKAKH